MELLPVRRPPILLMVLVLLCLTSVNSMARDTTLAVPVAAIGAGWDKNTSLLWTGWNW